MHLSSSPSHVLLTSSHVQPCVFISLFSSSSFQWIPILVCFNHLLIAINSAFNFLFYLSYCWGRKKLSKYTQHGWLVDCMYIALHVNRTLHGVHLILAAIVPVCCGNKQNCSVASWFVVLQSCQDEINTPNVVIDLCTHFFFMEMPD